MRDKERVDKDGKLRSRGYGFIEFEHHAHAMMALRQLNANPEEANRRLIVEYAVENMTALKSRDERLKRTDAKKRKLDEEQLEKDGKKPGKFARNREAKKQKLNPTETPNEKKVVASTDERVKPKLKKYQRYAKYAPRPQ